MAHILWAWGTSYTYNLGLTFDWSAALIILCALLTDLGRPRIVTVLSELFPVALLTVIWAPTEGEPFSKQPIKTGHVISYQPIRDQYFCSLPDTSVIVFIRFPPFPITLPMRVLETWREHVLTEWFPLAISCHSPIDFPGEGNRVCHVMPKYGVSRFAQIWCVTWWRIESDRVGGIVFFRVITRWCPYMACRGGWHVNIC